MHACLDDLVIALYVTIDELLEPRHGPGRRPKLADAELVCLAVAQILLGVHSERRWLRMVTTTLGHLFPYVCGQAAYNRWLRRAAPLDATPIPCGASRETVRRSELAGWAGYGYDRSHSRWYWGSSCTSWPARTGCRPPGVWPTRNRRTRGGRRAVGPRCPPAPAATRVGHPGRQGVCRPRVPTDRGRPGRGAGPPGPHRRTSPVRLPGWGAAVGRGDHRHAQRPARAGTPRRPHYPGCVGPGRPTTSRAGCRGLVQLAAR